MVKGKMENHKGKTPIRMLPGAPFPKHRKILVPPGRLELPHSCEQQILSLPRLPIPPQGPKKKTGNDRQGTGEPDHSEASVRVNCQAMCRLATDRPPVRAASCEPRRLSL